MIVSPLRVVTHSARLNGGYATDLLAGEGGELQLARLSRAHDADRPALEKEPDRDGRAIGPRNLLVLDVDSLLAPIDLELETLAYQGHCFALAGQSLTTDRASICVQLRMMKCESGDAAPA